MNVRSLRDRVLVKRVEGEEQRIGGIIIPDTAMKLDGEEYLIVREDEILGVAEGVREPSWRASKQVSPFVYHEETEAHGAGLVQSFIRDLRGPS